MTHDTQISTETQIAEAVESWPGVEAARHRFGGIEFRLGRRELGHIHGDRIADLPFPRRVRDELIADGRARPHHVLPDSGWITVSIRSDEDADRAIELFRMAYERARNARRGPRRRLIALASSSSPATTVVRLHACRVPARTMCRPCSASPLPRCVAVDPHDPNRVYVGHVRRRPVRDR